MGLKYFLRFIFIFYFMCMCVPLSVYHTYDTHRDQKMTVDPLKLELLEIMSLLCRCWDLNSDPVKEQYVLLTTESSL